MTMLVVYNTGFGHLAVGQSYMYHPPKRTNVAHLAIRVMLIQVTMMTCDVRIAGFLYSVADHSLHVSSTQYHY